MATNSLIGWVDVGLTDPVTPPSNYIDSYIGYVDSTLVAPAGPYMSSLIGYATSTLTAPKPPALPYMTKTSTGWRWVGLSVFKDVQWDTGELPTDAAATPGGGNTPSP